jgi:predicted nucleotidyltransferase
MIRSGAAHKARADSNGNDTMNVTPTESLIAEAVDRLHAAAPGATVILFGSYARGDSGPESDVDFLVVEPGVVSHHTEMVRLRDVLRPLRIPVDVLVTDVHTLDKWADTPGTLYYEIRREGRVYGP